MNLVFKKIILGLLLTIFLFQTSHVFALEIKWPILPGTKTPNQIQEEFKKGNISSSQRFSNYLNYFLRLLFVLALIVVSSVIVFGGVFYIFSINKPVLLIEAKQWITRGLFGFFIVVVSYLILAVLNPQLLIFRLKPSPSPLLLKESPLERKKEIILTQIPGSVFNEILKNDKLIKVDPNTGKILSPEKSSSKFLEIYLAQVPIYQTLKLLDQATSTLQELLEEFKNCECGMSKWHLKKISFNEYQCLPGIKKEDEDKFWEKQSNEINETVKMKSETKKTPYEKGIEILRKKVLGTSYVCQHTKCDNCGRGTPKCNFDKIKQHRDELKKILAKLQAQKLKFPAEQMEQVIQTLQQITAQFLLFESKAVFFQNDFNFLIKEAQKTKTKIIIEKPPVFTQTSQKVKMSPLSEDPLNTYIVVEQKGTKIVPPQIAKENKNLVFVESARASPSLVFLGLSLEEMEQLIKECLISAFENANFDLSKKEIEEFLNQSLKQGLVDFFTERIKDFVPQITSSFQENIEKSIKEIYRSSEYCEKNYDDPGCKNCEKYPPKFFTTLLSRLATEPLKKALPEEINALLKTPLKNVIFDKEINEIIDSNFLIF